ncbi:MAG: aspartate dehydrogenase, partial [Rhodospirillales bacterium]
MPTRVAIAGLGTIGFPVAEALHAGIKGLELAAVSSGGREKAEAKLAEAGIQAPVLENGELAAAAEV